MAKFRIGTYNVQNLFDRFDDPYSTGDDRYGKYRTNPKTRAHLFDAGMRIRENGVPRRQATHRQKPIDIVALQELENFGALLDFVQASVGPGYGAKTGVVSQPSNDPRGIDLGYLVRSDLFRIGRVISHRFNKFRRSDNVLYQFARDCLQIEILLESNREHFLTIFNCHFKSKYTGIDKFKKPHEYDREQENNSKKRKAEVDEVIKIVKATMNPDTDRFAICGDFNDTPNARPLIPLLADDNDLGLINSLSLIDQQDLNETSTVARPRDTHSWEKPINANGKKQREWAQLDYILCSPKLWELRTGIADVVNSPQEQGSDHYLSFAEFEIP